ncbi:DNA adenine methylase [Methylophaga thalassica]|uniref:DNA adenine methylase n=1 Tax=Methylophaga thalassica TaxID=40223 RepID=UPI002E7C4E7B|nr:DNA adenine methylase [Methylophaga thalassica]WVI85660.1 DNA adenine methylase [Methylophaga thalassica]
MYSNKLYTPLRYPGGKARFAPFIASIMTANGLEGGHYLEPFAGGAGVALELLFHQHASHVHINDIDPAIYFFWKAVTEASDELQKLLADTPINMEQWQRWREIMLGQRDGTLAEKGFATLFINRTNRSGILMAGVIGGKTQSGHYKMDARFNKDMISKRIDKIASKADSISVYNEDAYSLLNYASEKIPLNTLIYLDPPYYVKGKGLYRNFYEHQDHLAIASTLRRQNFKLPWIVSYDNTPEICEIYEGTRSLTYNLHYTAQKRYLGDEVMFFSEGLEVPIEHLPKKRA